MGKRQPSPTFGSTIRRLRKDAGLTQRALAEAVGVDFTYLSKVENGHGMAPSETTVRAIAAAVNAPALAEELVFAAGMIPEWITAKLLDMAPDEAITLVSGNSRDAVLEDLAVRAMRDPITVFIERPSHLADWLRSMKGGRR